jgi:hypothetical protein
MFTMGKLMETGSIFVVARDSDMRVMAWQLLSFWGDDNILKLEIVLVQHRKYINYH